MTVCFVFLFVWFVWMGGEGGGRRLVIGLLGGEGRGCDGRAGGGISGGVIGRED